MVKVGEEVVVMMVVVFLGGVVLKPLGMRTLLFCDVFMALMTLSFPKTCAHTMFGINWKGRRLSFASGSARRCHEQCTLGRSLEAEGAMSV